MSPDLALALSLADAAQLAETLPRSPGELLKLLSVCGNTAKVLISEGQLGLVHLPAMLAKDIAIVLEGYASGLTERQKVRAANAAKRLVVAAWKLITYGDLRDGEKLSESLLHANEPLAPTRYSGILFASPRATDHAVLARALDELMESALARRGARTLDLLQRLVPEYTPDADRVRLAASR